MSWKQFSKGQEVRFRALGGWLKGHVSEVYDSSVSVAFNRGAALRNIRIYDIRNIELWRSDKERNQSKSQEQQSFDF